jgi:hypothetical protein
MGDWEISVQDGEGGIMEGVVGPRAPRSIVFNTGMVLHGFLDLAEVGCGERFLEAGRRAGDWLVARQAADGAWRGEATYARIPHTYNARAAWALVRLADQTGEERYRAAARGKLDWVLSRQRANGWFEDNVFRPGMLPSTHSIAYTLRGLLESGLLLGERAYVDAARRGVMPLVDLVLGEHRLPATYDADWHPRAWYECLTGNAQIGGVCLRLHQVDGDARLRDAGLAAIGRAAAHQVRSFPRPAVGAIAGSFPIFGRYAPLQYPNWATKFLVDSLMLAQELLGSGGGKAGVPPGSVPRSIPRHGIGAAVGPLIPTSPGADPRGVRT